MDYKSICYSNSNEVGMEQIDIVKNGSWILRLRNIILQFNLHADSSYKEVWVRSDGNWKNKLTGAEAEFEKRLELFVIKLEFTHLS